MRGDLGTPIELEDFLNWEPTYPRGIIGDGVLYEYCKGLLYGRYKSLKSMAVMDLCLALAYGQSWFGFETPAEGVPVLYVQLEMPAALLHKRLAKMSYHWLEQHGLKPKDKLQPIWLWSTSYLKLDTDRGMKELMDATESLRPRLVVLDPLYKVLSGNILDPNQVRVLADSLDKFISSHKVAILLAHHARKSAIDMEDHQWGSDDMLGSAVFSWWADTVLRLARKEEKNNQIALNLNCDVTRYAEDELENKEVVFDRKTMLFSVVEPAIKV